MFLQFWFIQFYTASNFSTHLIKSKVRWVRKWKMLGLVWLETVQSMCIFTVKVKLLKKNKM